MPSKGFNSILFDYDSIIDKELSVINYIYGEKLDHPKLKNDKIKKSDNVLMRLMRMHSDVNLLESLLVDDEDKKNYRNIIEDIYYNHFKEIVDKNYIVHTGMLLLISAYKKAGNGVISTAVRCDNEEQVNYLKNINKDIVAFVQKREDVNMSKYGRLIVGYYKSAMQYVLNEPKSILILNYTENFDHDTFLNPELVISLGDIHRIEIISAFQQIENLING